MLAVAHALLSGDQQRFTGFGVNMVAFAIAVLRFTFQNQIQNIDFWIGTWLERGTRCQHFLIQHAQ